ncbi:MAG: prolyl oligopeptidase family serine peptidase [Armatimonadetes bacterium]|nr:prolyl oligopeptidase family serine peptidase [Armatimonadota bacterium]
MYIVPADQWTSGWAGSSAAIQPESADRTPDGERPVRVLLNRPGGESLPGMARSFAPMPLSGDVAVFWFRADRPIARLQVILTDRDGVGAETAVADLLGEKAVEPGRWHYAVWPFRTHPGWVRYKRGQVDWQAVQSISFYTWPDQLQPEATLEVGPLQTMTYAALEAVFEKDPGRAGRNRPVPWRVLSGRRTDRMMPDYHCRRAAEMAARLRALYPPERFVKEADRIRKAMAVAYMMPPANRTPEASLQRIVEVDGIRIEHQLLKIREGVFSTALVFLPQPGKDAGGRRNPAILMLPGHGDPSWSPAVQSRCLSFVRRGYVVMLVQPFGQTERGEISTWNETHDGQATAFLMTTGQSLLGLIMSDHIAETNYLLSRKDVDLGRVAVTGVSMGGTHTLWLMAIDTRLRAGAAVAAAPLYQPDQSHRHHGLCDLMVGAYRAADMETIKALAAPRALLHIHPSTERPLTEEGARLFFEGWIGNEEALARYPMEDRQIARLHRFAHEVYTLRGDPSGYRDQIIEGPHDYTPSMREAAAGWFAEHLKGEPVTRPEPALSPLTDRAEAIRTLNFWPDGKRPPEALSPTAYVQRETARLCARLPKPPQSADEWKSLSRKMRSGVRKRLGAGITAEKRIEEVGTARAEKGAVYKLVVRPEPGIELPALLFAPEDGAAPDGRLVALLHPGGMAIPASSNERRQLTGQGAWALCADLRGMGETRYDQESGGYLGFRDLDIGMAALKLGDTLAGYWVKDLLAVIAAARKKIGRKVEVTAIGEMETGLVAVLAAGQSQTIRAVEARKLLASCHSPRGYGLPFAYSDEHNDKSVRSRALGGYGSILPCIPSLLQVADIPQLAALVAPRPLAIMDPLDASGNPLPEAEMQRAFMWTKRVYEALDAAEKLAVEKGR